MPSRLYVLWPDFYHFLLLPFPLGSLYGSLAFLPHRSTTERRFFLSPPHHKNQLSFFTFFLEAALSFSLDQPFQLFEEKVFQMWIFERMSLFLHAPNLHPCSPVRLHLLFVKTEVSPRIKDPSFFLRTFGPRRWTKHPETLRPCS